MWTFESKRAVTGFLLTVALLLTNAGVSYRNTLQLVETEHRVTHTHQVLEALDAIRAAAAEAEAGQRGYLITGHADYQKTYQAAATHLAEQLDDLVGLTSDNPPQQARAAKLRELVQSRLQRLQYNIAVRQSDGFEAAQQIVGTDQGQLLMEQIRDTAQSIEAVENDLLDLRDAKSDRSLHVKLLTNTVGTLLGITAVCLAFYLFRRTLAERRRTELVAQARARRQAAIGELRRRALSEDDVDLLLEKATGMVAEALDVPLVKVLELLPDGQAFLLRAGVGWSEARIGETTVSAGLDSQAGFTLHSSKPAVGGDLTTHEPVVVQDLRHETRFHGPAILQQHGVVSGMSVIIYDQPGRPFGVLGAHTTCQRKFTGEEAHFLQAMANVLATAIQRRRAEDALRDSEKRFRALADSVPEIVWTSLPDGRCDYVNRRWHDFTGLTTEEALGFGWVEALHEDDVQRSSDRWMHAMETGEPFHCDYRFRTKDQTYRWCVGRALPLRDEQGRVVKWFGNCTDIDEYKRMEEALQVADRRKDQFLAMLGHELRNPLTPICNAVELLRLKSPDDPEIQWSADTIIHQTDQIIHLVDDLLDVSRIVHGKIRLDREMVDLRTIAGRAVETCRPLIDGKKHRLTVSLPEQAVWLRADPMRLVQVVENLLTNAVRYTEEGGRIWLTAECDGDQAILRIRDSGIGIASDMLPRLFELFAQADEPLVRSQGGLGLGLRLTASLVEMHGGSIEALSDGPGKGSEFVVRLPAASPEDPETGPPQPPDIDARATAPQRVLVVDDHASVAESIARVLRKKGQEVRTARDANEALAEIEAFEPSVVLTDIGLPGMNGFELATRLREQPATEQAVLIALTGFADEGVRRRVHQAGFDHLLVKPLDPAELDALLASVDTPSRAPAKSQGVGETAAPR